jgi:translation initiation factor 5
METKVRYVIKTSGSTKLSPKTLNMDGSDDPFYRYKMRELYIQVVGKGKMIKTVLLNVDDVSKDLKVPPAYLTAYLGYALNAQTKYDAKKPDRERASISGDIDADKMSQRIVDFMKEFVLCPKCKLPEITHNVDKKSGDVLATCRSCGEHSTLNLKDNFQRYINNHPHHFTIAKEETAVRKKQEAHAKEAALKTEKEKEAAENAAALSAERK